MLMVGASFLQLNKVRDACAEFLISRFHAYNVLGIRQFADSLSCARLVTAAEKYIHMYFAKVALSDEFLSLSEFNECTPAARLMPNLPGVFAGCFFLQVLMSSPT